MKKQDFLDKLKGSLWAMPETDIQNSLDYYSEMIDDRMEDGLSEEEAVAAVGDLDEIVSQILSETPRPPQTVKPEQKQVPARENTKTWMIILLIVGSPIWIPLVTSVVATTFSVYVSLWSVVAVLYVVAFAVGVAALGCLVGIFFMPGRPATAVVTLGAALLCAGLAILFFMLSNLAAKGMIALTKLAWKGIKSIFKGKEQTV